MKKLKNLHFSYSEIDSLPEELSLMNDIEELDLVWSTSDHFPSVICRMKNLKTLNLSGFKANFGDPLCLCSLKNLENLWIDYNKSRIWISREQYIELEKCLPRTKILYRNIE